MEDEPLAYLLGAREANNDPSNYWIFSATGLLRVLERSGWMPLGHRRSGCTLDSDPVRGTADERMIVIARSRTRFPGLEVRALEGVYPPEGDNWCWTARRFSLAVALAEGEAAAEFALRFHVPAGIGHARLTCAIDRRQAGAITCREAGTVEFRGRFPSAGHIATGALRLDFEVENALEPNEQEQRELGVILRLAGAGHNWRSRMPFSRVIRHAGGDPIHHVARWQMASQAVVVRGRFNTRRENRPYRHGAVRAR